MRVDPREKEARAALFAGAVENRNLPMLWWTLPNAISLGRLLLIGVFLWWMFGEPTHRLAAAILLAVLGATDWVDGYIARAQNVRSRVGAFVDPFADLLLLLVAGVSLVIVDALPLWFALLVLVREVLVLAVGLWLLLTRGIAGLNVNVVGKAGAFCLFFSLPFFLGSSVLEDTEWLRRLAWGFGIVGAGCYWWSLKDYAKQIRVRLRENA